jgi:hypothetical protein
MNPGFPCQQHSWCHTLLAVLCLNGYMPVFFEDGAVKPYVY